MKKVVISLFLILFVLPLVNSVQYTCPNPGDLQTDTEDIDEGKKDSLKGLPIGICGATENAFGGYISTTVFIDANILTIIGNATLGTEIATNETISASESDAEGSKIKIGSTSERLDIGDCGTISSTEVSIASISGEGSGATVKFLVGGSKIILDTLNTPSKLVDFNSKKYAIQLFSGTNSKSTIKVYTCSEGEITESEIPTPTNSTTNPTNATNSSTTDTNTSTNNNSTQNINESNTSTGGFIIEPKAKDESTGLFSKFWNWIKNLFS